MSCATPSIPIPMTKTRRRRRSMTWSAEAISRHSSDPVTHSTTTWVPTMDDTLQNVDQTDPGMTDVHSGSDQEGSDGQPYSTW